MTIDKNVVEKVFLNALKQAYVNYDCEYIIDKLSESFTYSSFWVFSSIDSAAEYIDYLEGKLNTQKNCNYKADFCLVRQIGTGKPILLVGPKTPKGDYACFIAECDNEGLICKLHVMPSSFYSWEPENTEEFNKFQDRNE